MASLMDSLQDNLSVLLVDDEEGFVQTLARRLGRRGLATLKGIKALQPDLPVILLTGHGSFESMQDILALGAYDYLSKPCDLETLLERIQSAVEDSR